ncbi:MAG TPA: glycosyltransferase [Terracidiphilus sp.]|jgi:glycosyltransferase involved in cell wall biosynthesis
MKHIAFVIPTLDRLGGAENQVILLAGGLLARKWKVSVVTLSGNGGEAARQLTAAGAGFLTLNMQKGLLDPRGWLRFRHWLVNERPDLVHAHLPHAVWMARWSCLLTPVPAQVDTIHTSDIGSLGRRIGYRLSSRLPARVCAVSQDVAKAYSSAGMVSSSTLTVLPNGIDLNYWRPETTVRISMRKQLGFADEFVWLAAGRLEPVKDYPTLLSAMTELPDQVHLLVAGAGSMNGQLRRFVDEAGLQKRVRFLDFQSDVRPYMRAADAFVLSSRWEGLPGCLMEAGACSLPMVATDVAGTREIIDSGRTGFLVAPESPCALRQGMRRTMEMRPEDRTAMGTRARQWMVEHYALPSVLDRWETLYRDLLDGCLHGRGIPISKAPDHR